jgi:hypothetical protein
MNWAELNPFSIKSCNFILSSANSFGGIRYDLLEMGAVSGFRLITNSTSLSRGNPGRSSGNTSRNFTCYQNILDFWYDSFIDPSKWFGWDSYRDGQENLFMAMAQFDSP